MGLPVHKLPGIEVLERLAANGRRQDKVPEEWSGRKYRRYVVKMNWQILSLDL